MLTSAIRACIGVPIYGYTLRVLREFRTVRGAGTGPRAYTAKARRTFAARAIATLEKISLTARLGFIVVALAA